jgi:hypothetical protein
MGACSSTTYLELYLGWMGSHMCVRLILCVCSSSLRTVQWVVTVCDTPMLIGVSSSTLRLELSLGWMGSRMCVRLILCVWSSSLRTVQWVVTVCDTPSSWRRILLLFALSCLSVGWDRACVCVLSCAYGLLLFARFSG